MKFLPKFLRRKRNIDRQIFEYFDGAEVRTVDPIEAWIAIDEHPVYRMDLHPRMVEEGDIEATRITCDAVQLAFGVKPYDPATKTGLTRMEQIALLANFCWFIESLKKNTEPLPISPFPTDANSKSSSEPTTSDTSDSGPIDTEPKSDTPTGSEAA